MDYKQEHVDQSIVLCQGEHVFRDVDIKVRVFKDVKRRSRCVLAQPCHAMVLQEVVLLLYVVPESL